MVMYLKPGHSFRAMSQRLEEHEIIKHKGTKRLQIAWRWRRPLREDNMLV